MTLIGYARVSTKEQNLDLQLNALEKAGCDKIFKDFGVCSIAVSKPGFDNALSAMQSGDTLVVWKMDRAFRSVKYAEAMFDYFKECSFNLRCLTEDIDTTTPVGKSMFQIRNVFAELERNIIIERTKAGMEAVRQSGKNIGRPRKLTAADIETIHTLKCEEHYTHQQIAKHFCISTRTLSRFLSKHPML